MHEPNKGSVTQNIEKLLEQVLDPVQMLGSFSAPEETEEAEAEARRRCKRTSLGTEVPIRVRARVEELTVGNCCPIGPSLLDDRVGAESPHALVATLLPRVFVSLRVSVSLFV